jgi:hypothetical protein
MIAVLSAIAADPLGVVELEIDFSGSDFNSLSRRISRTATLDGGVVLTDLGYSDGDRTVLLATPPDAEALAGLQYLLRNYGLVNVALPDGFYQTGLANLQANGENLAVSLLLKQRLSA